MYGILNGSIISCHDLMSSKTDRVYLMRFSHSKHKSSFSFTFLLREIHIKYVEQWLFLRTHMRWRSFYLQRALSLFIPTDSLFFLFNLTQPMGYFTRQMYLNRQYNFTITFYDVRIRRRRFLRINRFIKWIYKMIYFVGNFISYCILRLLFERGSIEIQIFEKQRWSWTMWDDLFLHKSPILILTAMNV